MTGHRVFVFWSVFKFATWLLLLMRLLAISWRWHSRERLLIAKAWVCRGICTGISCCYWWCNTWSCIELLARRVCAGICLSWSYSCLCWIWRCHWPLVCRFLGLSIVIVNMAYAMVSIPVDSIMIEYLFQ